MTVAARATTQKKVTDPDRAEHPLGPVIAVGEHRNHRRRACPLIERHSIPRNGQVWRESCDEKAIKSSQCWGHSSPRNGPVSINRYVRSDRLACQ